MSANTDSDRKPYDLFILSIVGMLTVGGLISAADAAWSEVIGWLLAHRILVPTQQDPAFGFPDAHGPAGTYPVSHSPQLKAQTQA